MTGNTAASPPDIRHNAFIDARSVDGSSPLDGRTQAKVALCDAGDAGRAHRTHQRRKLGAVEPGNVLGKVEEVALAGEYAPMIRVQARVGDVVGRISYVGTRG